MFRKYPNIENYDRKVTLDYWLRIYPELLKIRHIIEEKIHGTNIQLIFSPGKPYRVASREGVDTRERDEFGIFDVLASPIWIGNIAKLQDYADKNGGFNLYGEFYGPHVIHKGVNYGADKNIAFFDAWFDKDKEMLPQREFSEWLVYIGLQHYHVPVLCWDITLDKALEFNAEFSSIASVVPGEPAEGIVIKPYLKQYTSPDDKGNLKYFYLKKKCKKYDERFADRVVKEPAEIDERLLEYANENRVNSLESKVGRIKNKFDMRKYVQLALDDVLADFNNDHKDTDPEKVRLAKKSASSVIARILLKHLSDYLSGK